MSNTTAANFKPFTREEEKALNRALQREFEINKSPNDAIVVDDEDDDEPDYENDPGEEYEDDYEPTVEVRGEIGELVVKGDDKRLVFGWASVLTKSDGSVLVDRQGDYIDDDWEMESAAYRFMVDSRVGGHEHVRKGVATVVESMAFTAEKIALLGLPANFRRGWWIGMHVNDDHTWNLCKTGRFSGFSVHGLGRRTSYQPEVTPSVSKTASNISVVTFTVRD